MAYSTKKNLQRAFAILSAFVLTLSLAGCSKSPSTDNININNVSNSIASTNIGTGTGSDTSNTQSSYQPTTWNIQDYPDYYRVDGAAIVNYNVEIGEIRYSSLDALGRSGYAVGKITYDMYEASAGWRQEFDSSCDPSGWGHNEKVSISHANGKTYNGYMFNRSHLIADSLGGMADRRNLITGTRTQNVGTGSGGMAYIESICRDYISAHENGWIYYCATPVYEENELLPRSVYVDALSDDGSIDMHIETFNAAAGYAIDYNDGTFSAA